MGRRALDPQRLDRRALSRSPGSETGRALGPGALEPEGVLETRPLEMKNKAPGPNGSGAPPIQSVEFFDKLNQVFGQVFCILVKDFFHVGHIERGVPVIFKHRQHLAGGAVG